MNLLNFCIPFSMLALFGCADRNAADFMSFVAFREGHHRSGQTVDAGIQNARRVLRSGQFEIIRYDVHPFGPSAPQERTVWFEKLAIKNTVSIFHPKEYCDAFNAVMDDALLRRHGRRYERVRRSILPPPHAVKWTDVPTGD
jgi:hypothetical protein